MADHISQELVTRNKELEKTRNKLTSLEIQLRALEIAHGLTMTEEDNDLTSWYCKAYITLGEGRYEAVAKMARKGKKPCNLFGWLLKQEMNNRAMVR